MAPKSIDEILAVADDPAYHRVVTARIPLIRQDLRDEHARLDALLPTLTSDTIDEHPDRRAVVARIAEIEAEIEESIIEFRFRSIGHRAWADLLAKHPPKKAHLEMDRRLDHNPETFPFEAIAASCVEPMMTVEQVRQLDQSPLMDVKAWSMLWGACIAANVAADPPKSMAAGAIRRLSGEFGGRPTTTESPAASYSEE